MARPGAVPRAPDSVFAAARPGKLPTPWDRRTGHRMWSPSAAPIVGGRCQQVKEMLASPAEPAARLAESATSSSEGYHKLCEKYHKGPRLPDQLSRSRTVAARRPDWTRWRRGCNLKGRL
jgi:hypothetical protein